MSTQRTESGIALLCSTFALFQRLIHERTGVVLSRPELVVARLGGRLRALGLTSFERYYRHILNDPDEQQVMIDLLTTHETHFFREPHHFTFLRDVILGNHPPNTPYAVWCAACATGEEAWSVAMVLAERLGNTAFWSVLASDVSTGVLAIAQAGCYPRERLRSLPLRYRDRYCRCTLIDGTSQWVIAPELRNRVTFLPINLTTDLPEIGPFDLILLRNVDLLRPSDQTTGDRSVPDQASRWWLLLCRPCRNAHWLVQRRCAGQTHHLPTGLLMAPPAVVAIGASTGGPQVFGCASDRDGERRSQRAFGDAPRRSANDRPGSSELCCLWDATRRNCPGSRRPGSYARSNRWRNRQLFTLAWAHPYGACEISLGPSHSQPREAAVAQ